MFGRYRYLTGSGLSAIVQARGRRGIIKSIQRGTITLNNVTSNTATITAVDPNNAVLNYLGQRGGSTGGTMTIFQLSIELTNATTVTAKVNSANATNHVISYEVIEYYSGVVKSMQRSTMSGTTSPITATITAVDITKASLFQGAWITASVAGLEADTLQGHLDLQNSTTVRYTHDNTSGANYTIPYQVVEFF